MTHKYFFRAAAITFFGSASLLSAQNAATARLLAPISTKTSNVGDRFTALVEVPANLNGAILEGKITKLVQPKRGIGKGKPQIVFEFDTLSFQGRISNITADLKEVTNVSGVRGVDDEGTVIGKTSNKKRALLAIIGGGAGAAIGAAAGGAKGAAEGGAIGAAIGFTFALTMTTAGSDIVLQPGSHLTVDLYNK